MQKRRRAAISVSLERSIRLLVPAVVLVASPARAQMPPPADAPSPVPSGASASPAPVEPRWWTSLYGFAELDAAHDTSQSYGPASNNAILARPGTYAGAHARTQFTVNNSLVGLRVGAPEFARMRATGQVEVDFFGVQPTDATETTAFTTPSPRLRHFNVRLETPVFDVLAGQYHDLFAWGGEGFFQNSVAFLGVAGEIYHRNPQLRLSKTFASPSVRFEIALAAVRPSQRDSETPDFEGGVRFAWNGWLGAAAQGFGQPSVMPIAIGVSGVWRRFGVAEFLTSPGDAKTATGWGLAGNAFVPVIPAKSATRKNNALSVTAEVSAGTGISDLYTGLTGGALFPLLPDPSGGLIPPPLYRPNIDNGMVTYDADGNLRTIDWRAVVIGLQYYLPIDEGRFWIAATYSRLESPNILALTPEASRGGIFVRQDYVDGNLFATVTPALQLGLSYQMTQQTFGDFPFGGSHPQGRNHRTELGVRFFF
jgi:hypothetical protein